MNLFVWEKNNFIIKKYSNVTTDNERLDASIVWSSHFVSISIRGHNYLIIVSSQLHNNVGLTP